MKNWIFIRHSKAQRDWETVGQNLNTVADFQSFVDKHVPDENIQKAFLEYSDYVDSFNLSVSPNANDIPNAIKNINPAVTNIINNNLKGQVLDLFENESFEYVIEKNTTGNAEKGDYVIKDHMMSTKLCTTNNSKFLHLDKIAKYLEDNEWVALGTFFDMKREENVNRDNMIASSFFYTRDKNVHAIRNLSGGKHPKGHRFLACVNYCVFKKLKDENIILCYFNPSLISAPRRLEKMEGENHNVHSFPYEKDLREFIVKPKIRKGTLVNGNIFSEEGTVKIEMFGDSEYKYLYGNKPKIPFTIKTNLDYEEKHGVIHLDVNKHGYIIFEYDLDMYTKFNINRKKASTHRVEYTIFKDNE